MYSLKGQYRKVTTKKDGKESSKWVWGLVDLIQTQTEVEERQQAIEGAETKILYPELSFMEKQNINAIASKQILVLENGIYRYEQLGRWNRGRMKRADSSKVLHRLARIEEWILYGSKKWGAQAQLARDLGMSRSNLANMIRRYFPEYYDDAL